jgi:hypothetical protein
VRTRRGHALLACHCCVIFAVFGMQASGAWPALTAIVVQFAMALAFAVAEGVWGTVEVEDDGNVSRWRRWLRLP